MLVVLPDSFLVWLGVILLQVTMRAASTSTWLFDSKICPPGGLLPGSRAASAPTFGSAPWLCSILVLVFSRRLAPTLTFAFVWASLPQRVDFMFACHMVAALQVCVCPFVAAP